MIKDSHSPPPAKYSHLWLGSQGFLVGSVLVTVGTLLLPNVANLGDIEAMEQAYGDSAQRLQACALLIVFGFWAIVAGYSVLQQSIDEDGSAWAHIGLLFHIIGVAVWTIGMSLDISYPAAIVNWLAAPAEEVEIAHSVVTVLSPDGFGRGLFPMNVMINWLAFACLGIALLRSQQYTAWVGWYGLVIGVGGWVLGIAMTFTGREAIIEGFMILLVLTIIWWIALGILIARKIYRHKNQIINEAAN